MNVMLTELLSCEEAINARKMALGVSTGIQLHVGDGLPPSCFIFTKIPFCLHH